MKRDVISRLFLTALYSTLIVFSMTQRMINKFEIDVLFIVLLILVIHAISTIIFNFKQITNRNFYIFSTVVFCVGIIIIFFYKYWLFLILIKEVSDPHIKSETSFIIE